MSKSKVPIRKLTAKKGIPVHADQEKFFELVVLLARRSEGDPLFGGIKLNKLLFYADFLAYLTLGKAISGEEYFALENGPAPRHKKYLWEQMVKRGDIVVRHEHTVFDNKREVTLARRDPDIKKFSREELDLIYRVLENFRGQTGTDLSAFSHEFPGWRLAKEKETIPYTTVLVGDRKPTPHEIKRGLEIEQSLAHA
jgi:hypothetical protein